MTALAEATLAERPPLAANRRRLIARPQQAPALQHLADSLHVLTCGSVDDGKSTLIGRLLWDAGALHTDQRDTLERSASTAAGTPDFSLLVDGLTAEREQGITIDIAWRYFDTAARRLVIIDSPGHEQYTRNMATGASHADLAILLVDARSGIKVQTRRHAAILNLMGVRQLVLAVNKMDLVDWSEARFRWIEAEFLKIAERFGFHDAAAIPVSAVLGDNVAHPSDEMPWYEGTSLLDHLRQVPARRAHSGTAIRFPVQMVVRSGQDFRGLAGTVTSGAIETGAELVDALSGRRARVQRIVTMGRDLDSASAGQAVVLQLDTDIDVSRGAMLAAPGDAPFATHRLDARLVWLADEPFSPDRGYLLRTATDLVPIASLGITGRLDLATLTEVDARTCAANDIAAARIALGRPAALDTFARQPETGSFLLIDAITGATVAGGIVERTREETTRPPSHSFQLTRSLLRQGIGADLGHDSAAEAELRRRANEVAILMRGAGVAVQLEDQWTTAGLDASAIWLGLLTALSFGVVGAVVLGLF